MPDIDHVYADCAASEPVLACAEEAMLTEFANPNSVHADGRMARNALEDARERIAKCINAKPQQICFTPSATAACRAAISYYNITDCSPYEHKAVFDTVGWNQIFGMANDTATALMLANNETGQLFYHEVKELAEKKAVFTDATAAVGHFPIDVQDLGVVALAAGGHKFGAYPGIGFVYIRDGYTDLNEGTDPFFPGTPPVALAMAMANALEWRTENIVQNCQYLLEQRSALIEQIMKIPGAHINCIDKLRLPNIVSVRFDGVNARELLTMLDVNGVYASAGSACTADQDEPSHVLLASGLTEEQALSTIRLSFCPETTPSEFVFVSEALRRCVTQLRGLTK